MKTTLACAPITVIAVFILLSPTLHAAPTPEPRTAPLPESLEDVMKGITNRVLFQSLDDKREHKYLFALAAFSGGRESTNSAPFYMPWRILKWVDTNNVFRLVGAGNYVEFTMSVSDGNPQQKYGMPSSGFPQGSTNQFGATDVQLWANKELGDCDDIYHLHSESGGTNFTLLTAKERGKWIIIENRPGSGYTGYFDRGDASYLTGGKNDPHRSPLPDAPKPMIFDLVDKFEDFYGKAEVIKTELGSVRIWRKGDFIVWHIDDSPKKVLVAVEKAERRDFSEGEVFEVAERYCGKQEWNLEEKDDRWRIFTSKDHRLKLTWTLREVAGDGKASNPNQRVTLQFFPGNKRIKEL